MIVLLGKVSYGLWLWKYCIIQWTFLYLSEHQTFIRNVWWSWIDRESRCSNICFHLESEPLTELKNSDFFQLPFCQSSISRLCMGNLLNLKDPTKPNAIFTAHRRQTFRQLTFVVCSFYRYLWNLTLCGHCKLLHFSIFKKLISTLSLQVGVMWCSVMGQFDHYFSDFYKIAISLTIHLHFLILCLSGLVFST